MRRKLADFVCCRDWYVTLLAKPTTLPADGADELEHDSQSWRLEQAGWDGIHVEPQPDLARQRRLALHLRGRRRRRDGVAHARRKFRLGLNQSGEPLASVMCRPPAGGNELAGIDPQIASQAVP